MVRIHFTSDKPRLGTESVRNGAWSWTTSWNQSYARAYGFYSNVNPGRAHPGWSQAVERPLDGRIFARNIPTQLFNGYADEVADLYRGMDLIANY